MTFLQTLAALVVVSAITYVGNWIGYAVAAGPTTAPFDPLGAAIGIAIILAVTMAGWWIARNVRIKLESPMVIWISIIGLLITSPISPIQSFVVAMTKNVNFMAMTTPVLAYAGLSLGRDVVKFKALGWRILLVSLLVFTGTFVLATLFAQMTMRLTGTH